MEHILVKMMSQLTVLTEEEKSDIRHAFPITTFEKGTYLLKVGQVAKEGHHLISGCVREYKLLDGEEKTTAFYTENQSAINFNSIMNQTPSKVNFVCAERATVAIYNVEKEKELYEKHPRFETFCREGMEQMVGVKQEELAEMITLKPEQRYLKLQEERPELINRIPQHQIASYLGIKPETLSRIRARLTKKASVD